MILYATIGVAWVKIVPYWACNYIYYNTCTTKLTIKFNSIEARFQPEPVSRFVLESSSDLGAKNVANADAAIGVASLGPPPPEFFKIYNYINMAFCCIQHRKKWKSKQYSVQTTFHKIFI